MTFDGKQVNLSDFKGKVVLINFWASWCPPCKAEMQAIQNTYRAYGDQGLVVLAVNTTFQDDANAAQQFAQSEGLTFPLLTDLNGNTFRLYQVQAMPTSFFVDRQGKIAEVVIGGPMAEALIRSRVEALLKEGQ
jgi:peroxiredoxin